MAIAVSTSIVGLSVMGWRSVGGQLLASAVLMLSGHQDVGLRARFGAAFWFCGYSLLHLCPRYCDSSEASICRRDLRSDSLLRDSVDSACIPSEAFRLKVVGVISQFHK